MQYYPKILLIAGTGRNTGKTLMASSIIKKFSSKNKITGLKISPHFHSGTESLHTLHKSENFNIYQETSISSSKDSSRMLKAGANKVYYIECLDEFMKEAFELFLRLTAVNGPIVCESPALRKYLKPGVFIIVDNQSNNNKKQDILKIKSMADLFIETHKDDSNKIISRIRCSKHSWLIRTN